MSLLKQREGVSVLKVLSAIVRLEEAGKEVRQKNIAKNTVLSKGAVSNNCKKLVKEEVLHAKNEVYHIRTERLLELYRTHFEDYLRRRKVPARFKHYNEIKTATKRRIKSIFEGEIGDLLQSLILRVLSKAKKEGQINTIRDVFHRVDFLLRRIAEGVYSSDRDESFKENLLMLAVSMERAPDYLLPSEDFDFDLQKTTIFKMSENLKGSE